MTGYRKTHSISLTPNQEEKLEKVRKQTGYSIVKILMAMVVALEEPPVLKISQRVDKLLEEEI